MNQEMLSRYDQPGGLRAELRRAQLKRLQQYASESAENHASLTERAKSILTMYGRTASAVAVMAAIAVAPGLDGAVIDTEAEIGHVAASLQDIDGESAPPDDLVPQVASDADESEPANLLVDGAGKVHRYQAPEAGRSGGWIEVSSEARAPAAAPSSLCGADAAVNGPRVRATSRLMSCLENGPRPTTAAPGVAVSRSAMPSPKG